MLKNLGDTSFVLPAIIGTGLFAVGSIYFLTQWPYSEGGHGTIFAVFSGLCALLVFIMRHKKIILSLCLLLLIAATIVYAHQKFQWRKGYITVSQDGDHFALELYIDQYPLYEDHIFADFLDKPKYVSFSDECYKPALNGQTPDRKCRSLNLIENNYNVNVNEIIQNYYRKMQATAQQFEKGRIKDRRQYESCLRRKDCAIIPLLPSGTDVSAINADSQDHIDIRRKFWSLLDKDNRQISPELCEFVEFCRVMRDMNVVMISKPKL
jgi:hypothetical protein